MPTPRQLHRLCLLNCCSLWRPASAPSPGALPLLLSTSSLSVCHLHVHIPPPIQFLLLNTTIATLIWFLLCTPQPCKLNFDQQQRRRCRR
jgi:hypothetical protein